MTKENVPPEKTDYHVHCHLDGCAARDMTLSAIYEEGQPVCVKYAC